ncbi:Phytochrome-like protein cph1 [Mariniflexile rhizosphaerae]|uniref:CHASE3 domain-containing protein n=1 Tax=unclassified Mariniflexile TaxID=2643887 RepID=UPI000CC66205|nr:CHASE3 domain-containing protein [Mariniflexile sp. TRM1-10]AXP79659.1 Phytochrome-like protein cph1 [Mariniflexile sp. TRM1-10]PLB18954.1 MAG: Two-component system sensor histidine kinase [Flavobacteriaceae bacterium FS1-H7996/R]
MIRQVFTQSALFLRIVFLVSVFLILVIGGFTYRHISNLTASTKEVVNTYKVNVELEKVISYLKDAENGHRNYILTKDTTHLEPYLTAREKVNESFAELKETASDSKTQEENLKTLSKYIDKLFNNFTHTNAFVENKLTLTEEFKSNFFEEKIIMDSIRQIINEMVALENKQLKEDQKQHQSNLQFTPLFLYLLLLFTLVLIIISYNRISNDFKNIKTFNNQLSIFKEATIQLETIGKHGNWVWHVDTNTFVFSDNLYRVLGEKPGAFKSTLENFMDFVHPNDKQKFVDDIDKMMKVNDLPFIYFRIIKKDGTVRHIKAYGKLLVIGDGDKRIVGNITDISDEIENYLQLEERNLELEKNNAELSEFNYVASHDLQEPLRKIQIFISRLEENETKNFSSFGLQYLERIKASATRMRLLIDDLLQFSRTNKPDKEFVLTNLNDLFENAKQDVADTILEKEVTIISDVLPTIPVIPFQVHQLFLNLLSNSLKYCKKDVAPVINIGYSKINSKDDENLINASKNNYHKITFSDNGIGFEQQYANQIFELFNRLHNKHDYSGTGVGLSICKKIIDNHDGFIMAHGKPQVAATFTIYFPV